MRRHPLPEEKIDPATWIFLMYFAILIIMYMVSSTIIGAVILGLYLSMIIMVPARLLMKLKFIGRGAAVAISAVLVFTALSVTIIMIFPILIDEASNLFSTLSAGPVSWESILEGLPDIFSDLAGNTQALEIIQEIGTRVLSAFSSFGMSLLNDIVTSLPGMLTSVVIFIIASAYLTAMIPVLKKNLWRFFPKSTRKKSIKFVETYYSTIKSFIGGQVIIAGAVGLIIGIGFTIAGIPYAVFFGFLSFITNFIPYFGVIITSIPALFLGLTHYGLMGLIRVGFVLILANQIESWVLQPKVQGDRTELNWFIILVGILLFGSLFGIIGILFAIPIMVFIKEYWQTYVQEAFNRK
ncbi:MAG: AI-2E family transporter [Spirochaetales bacterium]|uniref:AI-2E family transporter n=1 Tax=Candidatus Thalassospirochaeta sargassi TaxID=3119039 RepID=A0AAJ1MKJ4_9SPIO|nr:AI-2E family transporter [Spirochaetales bacterium]